MTFCTHLLISLLSSPLLSLPLSVSPSLCLSVSLSLCIPFSICLAPISFFYFYPSLSTPTTHTLCLLFFSSSLMPVMLTLQKRCLMPFAIISSSPLMEATSGWCVHSQSLSVHSQSSSIHSHSLSAHSHSLSVHSHSLSVHSHSLSVHSHSLSVHS